MTENDQQSLEEWISQFESTNYDGCVINNFLLSLLSKQGSITIPHHLHNTVMNLIDMILHNASIEWAMDPKSECQLISVVSMLSLQVVLPSLCSTISKLSVGARFQLVVAILDTIFHQHCFVNITLAECRNMSSNNEVSNIVIRLITSLPEVVANKGQTGLRPHIFHHEKFFIFLGFEIVSALNQLANDVSMGKSVKTEFLSKCVGQFCRIGKAAQLFQVLIPSIVLKIESDFILQRILQQLFKGIPDVSLESVLTHLFQVWSIPHQLVHVLGDIVSTKPKAKFVILYKLLLIKHYNTYTVPRNVITYISTLDATNKTTIETLQKVIETWSSGSSIKHTSYEQHRYITAVIILCVKHLRDIKDQKTKDDIMLLLMSGMKHHLESPDIKVRTLGMLVGEKLSAALKMTTEETRLEFEYPITDDTRELLNLFQDEKSPDQKFFDAQQELLQKTKQELTQLRDSYTAHKNVYTIPKSSFVEMAKVKQIELSVSKAANPKDCTTGSKDGDASDDSEDSDDDLVPYDLPQESTFTKTARPMYIRDCMEGLIENEDRDKMEIYLSSVDELIRKDAAATKEVAVETCKILLNLQNNYSLDGFDGLRRGAIASAVVCNPREVAAYLTTEFYSEHYNIQQRLDILDVLVMAAGRISRINSNKKKSPDEIKKVSDKATQPSTATVEKSWKQIVQERIEAKTRRFGKVRKPTVVPTADEFGPVAGFFFYPLMSAYDRHIRTLDLLGTDSIVLGRLLYALGTILFSAANSMIAHKMSSSLLEFTGPLRSHVEPFVRKACVFCVSMAVVSSPNVTDDLCEEVLAAREWLCDVINADDDGQVRLVAMDALGALDSKAKRELGTNSSVG